MIFKFLKILFNLNRVAELAQCTEIQRKPTLEELLSTIINRDEIEKLIQQPVRIIIFFHLNIFCFYKKKRVVVFLVIMEKNVQL
jgi:hypothetical protein